MKIADIRVGDRARHEPGEIASLVRSIEQVGLLHPVVVTRNNELVSGFRRIEAYKQLGRDEIPHTVAENLDDALKLLKAERDENTERKQLTRSEAVALAKKLRPLERTEAEERQRDDSDKEHLRGGPIRQEQEPEGERGGRNLRDRRGEVHRAGGGSGLALRDPSALGAGGGEAKGAAEQLPFSADGAAAGHGPAEHEGEGGARGGRGHAGSGIAGTS